MLAAGFILLLTVLIPHHHHEGGEVCVFLWDSEHQEDGHDEDSERHGCECNGHTIAFNAASLHKHASETHDLALLLIPLCTLFDSINPPLLSPDSKAPGPGEDERAGSLFSLWIPAAAGFRAPPFC